LVEQDAQIGSPRYIQLDPKQENLYVITSAGIRQINLLGGVVRSLAGAKVDNIDAPASALCFAPPVLNTSIAEIYMAVNRHVESRIAHATLRIDGSRKFSA
jgi:hypothetical protein